MTDKPNQIRTSTIRLPIELAKALNHMAVDNERSLNNEMIFALKKYVDLNGKGEGSDQQK